MSYDWSSLPERSLLDEFLERRIKIKAYEFEELLRKVRHDLLKDEDNGEADCEDPEGDPHLEVRWTGKKLPRRGQGPRG